MPTTERPAFLLLEAADWADELRAALRRTRAFAIQAASSEEALEILTKVRIRAVVSADLAALQAVAEGVRHLPLTTRSAINSRYVLLSPDAAALPAEILRAPVHDAEGLTVWLRQL